jgi:hypothetical protein
MSGSRLHAAGVRNRSRASSFSIATLCESRGICSGRRQRRLCRQTAPRIDRSRYRRQEWLEREAFDQRRFVRSRPRRWASWNNRQSFWIQREYLIQAIRDVGFDSVLEQYDGLGSDIAGEMTVGSYRMSGRSTFIGLKTSFLDEALSGPRSLRRQALVGADALRFESIPSAE